jgi:antitoxin component YwqK of YwqJK toxin-antitoxin module
MKNSKRLYLSFYTLLLLTLTFVTKAQKYVEPGKLKQFNVVVNYDDYTVKTKMLSQTKDLKVNNDLTYMWYASQKIIETKGGYEGKLIHGSYTSFYLSNQLREQGQIKYGLKHGEWKAWYPDGKLKEIITWKNGRKNGNYELYNDLGQRMAKSKFKNDKLNGKFYTYSGNGVIAEKKKYKDGNEVIPKVKIKKEKKAKVETEKKDTPATESKPKEKRKNKKKVEADPNAPSNSMPKAKKTPFYKKWFQKKSKPAVSDSTQITPTGKNV